MSVEHSLLGKDTNYPPTYQPDILFPIARATAREHYAHVEGIQQGKEIGIILKEAENQWAQNNFNLSAEDFELIIKKNTISN